MMTVDLRKFEKQRKLNINFFIKLIIFMHVNTLEPYTNVYDFTLSIQ